MSEFSNNTPTGSTEASPVAKPAPSEAKGGMLTMATAGTADEPSVDIALRWSRLYENDIELRPFWKWIHDRSNPERTDFNELLLSIPAYFGPDQIPLPLRKFFLRKFGDEKSR